MADGKEVERIADHLEVLNGEMGDVKEDVSEIREDMAGVKVDVSWLKKIQWWILGLLVSGLLGGVLNYVLNNP